MSRLLPILTLLAAVAASWFFVTTGVAKPEHLVTLLGIASGAAIVAYQLGEQQKASLALQKENARQALKLKVYEQLLEKVTKAVDTSNACSGYVRSIEASIDIYLQGVPWSQTATIAGFRKKFYKASDSLIELIGQLERWEVSFASADLFRLALSSACEDVGRAHNDLFKLILQLLPDDKHAPVRIANVAKEDLQLIQRCAKQYLEACSVLGSYFHDLVVEAQNELLGGLFDRRVKKREPLDPRYRVVSEVDRTELLRHFKEDTHQGRTLEDARNRVRKRIAEGGNLEDNE